MNKSYKFAKDFGLYSKRIERCKLTVCDIQCHAEYGAKDKQDGRLIYFHVPW